MDFSVRLLPSKTKQQKWNVSDGLCTFLFRHGRKKKKEVTNTCFKLAAPMLQVFNVCMEGKAVAEQICPL